MGRVAGAAFAGTTIEFYDFFIFGTATALVFGQVFFAELGGGRGTLALGATYAVAFVARPIGSVIFGHIGDRLGRKRTLIYTLLLMGGSTFAIGLIPSYDSIGEYQVRQTPDGADIDVRCLRPTESAILTGDRANELRRLGLADPVVTVRQVEAVERGTVGKLKRFVPLGESGGR